MNSADFVFQPVQKFADQNVAFDIRWRWRIAVNRALEALGVDFGDREALGRRVCGWRRAIGCGRAVLCVDLNLARVHGGADDGVALGWRRLTPALGGFAFCGRSREPSR